MTPDGPHQRPLSDQPFEQNRSTVSSQLSAEAQLQPPSVPGYTITACRARILGGALYAARALRLDRPVIIEWRPASLGAASPRRERLLKEAVAKIAHPHLAPFIEYGQTPEGSYLVVGEVGATPLSQISRRQPMPPRQAASLVESVARGLHQAHLRGLAHGNLDLSHVMIDAEGAPFVLAFGLWSARLPKGSPRALSYQAPEQLTPERAEPTLDVDVYAAGAMLYELLTGRPAFVGATTEETARQILKQHFVRPRALVPSIPKDLEAICMKCLCRASSGRYESAEELAIDLGRHLAGEPVHARRGLFRKVRGWWNVGPVAAAAGTLLAAGVLCAALVALRLSGDLRTAREELADLRQLVEERQVRDDVNLREAILALDRVVQLASREELNRLPQFDPYRNRMLELARSFHEALGRRNSFDEEMKYFVALSKFHVADLNRQLGFPDTSGLQFIQTLAIVRELKRDSVPTMELVARCNLSDGLMRAASGEHEQAEISFKTAVDAYKRLQDAMPGEPRFALDKARALRYRALLRIELRRPSEALPDLEEALALLAPLPAAEIPPEELDLLKSRCLADLAQVQQLLDQANQAQESLRQARKLIDALQASQKREFDFRYEQATLLAAQAALRAQESKHAAALEVYEQAIALFERLHAENTASVLVTRQLAHALAGRTQSAAAAGTGADQLAAWQQVIGLREQLAGAANASPGDQLDLAAACRQAAAVAADPQQAGALLDRSVAISTVLFEAQRALPWSAAELAEGKRAMAMLQRAKGRVDEAASLLEEAVGARRKAAAADPSNRAAHASLLEDLAGWAELLQQLGQDAQAQRALEEAEKARQRGVRP
jgi:tetratricopeptide (TPR) repeat protein